MENKQEFLDLMKEKGIVFESATDVIDNETRTNIANDAALVTTPNTAVPSLATSFIDPMLVDILTAPRNAREIFPEVKKGDWASTTAMFKVVESVGKSTAYGDFSNGATADVNFNFPVRTNYRAQINIRYGDLEVATAGKAAIDLISRKQQAAARQISIDTNKIYLYGVANTQVYGLLNEPNLPAAINPINVGTEESPVTKWESKTTQQIYNDILKAFAKLEENSEGLITSDQELKLVVPPTINVLLAKATDYNVSVYSMLEKFFPNLKIVLLPELHTSATDKIMLVASNVDNQPTGEMAYSEKMRAHNVVQRNSYWEQKYSFGVYGCVLYRPFAVATMTGV